MVGNDYAYFKKCLELGFVKSQILEIGSAKIEGQSGNICDVAKSMGVSAIGADICPGPGADIVADFASDSFKDSWTFGQYETVVVFNVLEHTFNPIAVLSNAVSCVKPGGWVLVVVPAVWPIHNYPGDYSRLLPNWFEEFARRRSLEISENAFCWLSQFGITSVRRSDHEGGEYELPSFLNVGKSANRLKYWRSKIGHRLLNSYGRSHWYGHCALGVALRKRRDSLENMPCS